MSGSLGQHHTYSSLDLDDALQPMFALLPCQVTAAVGLEHLHPLTEELVLSREHAGTVGGLEPSQPSTNLKETRIAIYNAKLEHSFTSTQHYTTQQHSTLHHTTPHPHPHPHHATPRHATNRMLISCDLCYTDSSTKNPEEIVEAEKLIFVLWIKTFRFPA